MILAVLCLLPLKMKTLTACHVTQEDKQSEYLNPAYKERFINFAEQPRCAHQSYMFNPTLTTTWSQRG